MKTQDLANVAGRKLIHLTTRGRKTGKPHVVELWFAAANGNVYLSHEGQETDWMKNITKDPAITFEIGGKQFRGRGCYLQDGAEEAWVGKAALYEKYYGKATREIIEDWFSLSKLFIIVPTE